MVINFDGLPVRSRTGEGVALETFDLLGEWMVCHLLLPGRFGSALQPSKPRHGRRVVRDGLDIFHTYWRN